MILQNLKVYQACKLGTYYKYASGTITTPKRTRVVNCCITINYPTWLQTINDD